MTIKPVNKTNFWFAVAMFVLGVAGMLHTVYGTWTKFAGQAAKFFPRCIYVCLMICALVLIAQELLHKMPKEPKALPDMRFYYPILFTAAGVAFFLAVYYVGPIVGVFAFLFPMMLAFSPDPKRDLPKTLLIAALSTGAIYLIFTKLIVLLLPGSLLF